MKTQAGCAIVGVLALMLCAGAAWADSIATRPEYKASTDLVLGAWGSEWGGSEGYVIAEEFQLNLLYQAGVLNADIDAINDYWEPMGWTYNFGDNDEYVLKVDVAGNLPVYTYPDVTEAGGPEIQWTLTAWHQTILAGDLVDEGGTTFLRVLPAHTYRPFPNDPPVNNVEIFDGDMDCEVSGYTLDVALADIPTTDLTGKTLAIRLSVIEVSLPVQVTSNEYYERGQAIVHDGTNYWLFYGRSASVTVPYSGGNPDISDYSIYYKKATSVAGLAAATPTAVPGATSCYLGESGAAVVDGKVWAFASLPSTTYPGRRSLYGWYTTTGASWTQVADLADDMSDGAAHHDEVGFDVGGEDRLYVMVNNADGNTGWYTKYTDDPTAGTITWSAYKPLATPDLINGTGHFFVDNGTELYIGLLRTSPTKDNKLLEYVPAGDSWSEIATTASTGWDGTFFKAGSSYMFAQAPWIGAESRQYILAWANNTLDSTFFDNGSKMVSAGQYGAEKWVDMWPIGFVDAGDDSYLFFTSERKAGAPGPETAANIWYLKVDWGLSYDHYTYIQEAINGATGTIINVAAGSYEENIYIDKSLEMAGAGQASTTIYPAVSSPLCGSESSLCGAANARDKAVILVEASDVMIHDLTVDGDNPLLVSGEIVNGADIDARNGIIENYYLGVFDNLVVYNCTIQNIYLRGLYASSGGLDFDFHDNTVDNVDGDPSSIAIMNWGATGNIEGNTVSNSMGGIVANHSSGMTVWFNDVISTDDPIHTDNAGDLGFAAGASDVIADNTVTGGLGIGVFNPLMSVTVENNTSIDADEGLWTSALQAGGAVPEFLNNTVDGLDRAGSIGFYETTDMFGWGFGDVDAVFTGNTIRNVETGMLLEEADPATSVTLDASQNLIADCIVDAVSVSASATADVTLFNNSLAGYGGMAIAITGAATVNASGNWLGVATPGGVGAVVDAGVDYTPWLDVGTDVGGDPSDGFQGDFSALSVDDDSSQTGATGRIQEGVDLVSGSTVNVVAGTYGENLTVDKSVALLGAPGAIIDGTALTGTAVKIQSSDVTFDGFEVRNFTSSGIGILVGYETSPPGNLQNVHITNNVIHDIAHATHGFGLYVGYESEGFGYEPPHLTGHLDYSGLLIQGNEIYNTSNAALILQSITATVGTLDVLGNNFHDASASGIWIDCGRNINIDDNQMNNNNYGMFLSAYAEAWYLEDGPYGPKDIQVTNSTISGNATMAFGLFNGWTSTISLNLNNSN